MGSEVGTHRSPARKTLQEIRRQGCKDEKKRIK